VVNVIVKADLATRKTWVPLQAYLAEQGFTRVIENEEFVMFVNKRR